MYLLEKFLRRVLRKDPRNYNLTLQGDGDRIWIIAMAIIKILQKYVHNYDNEDYEIYILDFAMSDNF